MALYLFRFVARGLIPVCFALLLARGETSASPISSLCLELRHPKLSCGQNFSDAHIVGSIYRLWLQGDVSLSPEQISALFPSVSSLSDELMDLGLDSESMQFHLQSSSVSSKENTDSKGNDPLKLKAVRLSGSSGSGQNHFGMETRGEARFLGSTMILDLALDSIDSGAGIHQKRLQLREAYLDTQPHRLLRSLRLGRWQHLEGLGIAASGVQNGILLQGQVESQDVQLGWLNGLYASVTTPRILGAPFTFYTKHQDNAKANRVFHSGMHVSHQMGRLSLNYHLGESVERGSAKGLDQRIQAYHLEFSEARYGARLLWHRTGKDYQSGFRDGGHFSLSLLENSNLTLAQRHLSLLHGTLAGELSGYDQIGADLYLDTGKFRLTVAGSEAKPLGLNSGFHVLGLGIKFKSGTQYRSSLGISRLNWDRTNRPGQDSTVIHGAYHLPF